jgi:hypothetical protein
MEIQSIEDKLKKIQSDEEEKTVAFIRNQFGRNLKVLDISNKYLVKDSFEYFCVCLTNHLKKYNQYKTLILQNCLLTNIAFTKLLNSILKIKNRHQLTSLDITNNQIDLSEKIGKKICKFFESGPKKKEVRLILQGNILTCGMCMNSILSTNRDFKELNLYDTRLSPEALLCISESISKNKSIQILNLSYNPSAFSSSDIVHTFGISVGINNKIEYLNLSGNTPLHKNVLLIKLLSGISSNTSLLEIVLGNLNLKDKAVDILVKTLFPSMPISSLNLQSNQITWKGFDLLLSSLSESVTSLDVSYNDLKSNMVLESLGKVLKSNRTLRKLNMSYSIELQNLKASSLDLLCKGLTANVSLSEILCEGIKISEDPDEFCYKLSEAISDRKFSLTFKISAVNCFSDIDNSTI